MKEEFTTLDSNHTLSIMPFPISKQAKGCRWIFKSKFNSYRIIKQHKARLVAQGFS
jgi:hypothetical protein